MARYLRVVVTARCPMACSYCHMEGDPAAPGLASGLGTEDLVEILHAGLDAGICKLKFLGGEPLLRRDLPEVIAALRARAPDLDISVITSGAVPREGLDACFAAGLSRANLSIHGFGPEAFARRGGSERMRALRDAFLDALLAWGRPVKLNYVYGGKADLDDLGALLDAAARWPVVVNVLDDLGDARLGPQAVIDAVVRLRGAPARRWIEPDPHSLPTLRLGWTDGLVVEVKTERLGEVAPWADCAACPVRARCREGIHALRLTHTGVLRPCMDRPDLGVPLLPQLRRGGRTAVRDAWRAFLRAHARPARVGEAA